MENFGNLIFGFCFFVIKYIEIPTATLIRYCNDDLTICYSCRYYCSLFIGVLF